MKHKINISIPQPCHENWQLMTRMEKGKFCALCQKQVYDFTAFSDREIVNALNKDNDLCGRFDVSQLDRDLIIPKEKNRLWIVAATAAVSFLGMATQRSYSQGNSGIEQNEKTVVPYKNSTKELVELTGTVSDSDSLPLSNVTVSIGTKSDSTVTDSLGNFRICCNKGNTLTFSINDYSTKKYIAIKSEENLKFHLDRLLCTTVHHTVSLGIIVFTKKRTFAGRILNSIGSLFRSYD